MRYSRLALIAAAAFTTACASDGTTSPNTTAGDTRLAAVATITSANFTDGSPVSLRVAVTSTLTEQVTGGACAQRVEARPVGSTTWTDVTSSEGLCSANILLLSPGGTVQVTGVASATKLRTVDTSSKTVVIRVRHVFTGASTAYNMQSSEVSVVLP